MQAFNEVENDLEVVDFTVMDSHSDASTTGPILWPFHLDQNKPCSHRLGFAWRTCQSVGGSRRSERVTLRAVPPKNLSGGPDEWPVNRSCGPFVDG